MVIAKQGDANVLLLVTEQAQVRLGTGGAVDGIAWLGYQLSELLSIEHFLGCRLHAYRCSSLGSRSSRGAREALENPSNPRENTRVIAGTDWVHGQQAARIQ